MNRLLLHRCNKVWTEAIDGYQINWKIEARFEKVCNAHEVVKGLCGRLEVDQYVDVTGIAGIIASDRSKERDISHAELAELREEVSQDL